MRISRFVLLPILALCLLGMGRKQLPFSVRFFTEANPNDTEKFATPIKFVNPPREGYIEKVPSISERNVKAIYPFPAADGSMGCAFQLDHSGRINLEVVSTERRGTSLVVFVATKQGARQVLDMVIDRSVRDGIITIQRGLTEREIDAMKKQWPVIGGKK